MEKTAMIGFGCAGYHALRTMRQQGYQGEIHVYANVSPPTMWLAAFPMRACSLSGAFRSWPRSTRPSCIWIPMSCG